MMCLSENLNNAEFIKKQVEKLTKSSRPDINRIIGIASILKESGEHNELIHDLFLSGYRLLAQNMNSMHLYSDELFSTPGVVINAADFLNGIIGECANMLESLETELRLEVKCELSSIKIDEKAFIIAVMNLLQNALLYSPPKTAVIVILDNVCAEEKNYVCITVKNLLEIEKNNSDYEERSGQGLFVCTKIAEHYGGKLEYVQEGGSVSANLMLPLEGECSGIGLSCDFAMYLSDENKPVKLFMHEVLTAKRKNNKVDSLCLTKL